MNASRRGLERDGYAYVPPREDGLSGQDAWDDSALMDAYNSAVERYKITHGLGAGSASGAARATLSPSVGGSRNATPASPARGGVAGAPSRSPAPASPAPPPRRSPLPGNPATSASDPRSAPGGESASWDAYYAHYAAHAHGPPQGEYYDPYHGYDAGPPPIHDYPGRHPRHHPRPRSRPPGAPPFPGGFRHPPPPPPRGYGGPPGPPGPRGAFDAYATRDHHHVGRASPPPPPPLGGDVGRRARAAASSALDAGAAGDYQGAHPEADVDELANLLMAWYYAGYYTGQYSKRGGSEDAGAEEGTY